MSMKVNDDEIKFDFSFFESGDSLLNMNTSYIKRESKKKARSKTQVLLLFLLIIFILAYCFGKKTRYFSLLIFANNDYKRCTLLNKLDLYQYNIRYIFLFFMYSYINIYSSFCYLVLDIVGNSLNDIIRLCFFESRPFWDNNEIVFPCVCELTPSQPSQTSSNSFLFLSLIYFLREEERKKHKIRKMNNKKTNFKIYKESDDENSELKEETSENLSISQNENYHNIGLNFLMIFIIGIIIFVDTIPLLQNIEYLHQTLFGLLLGFALYYWIFYIVKVNHLNRKQFLKIMKQPWIVMTFCLILAIIILSISNNINKRILFSQILKIQKFCEIPKNINSSKDILNNCILIFEIIGAYCGLLLEYKKNFNSDDNKFTLYNVKGKNGEGYFEEKSGIIKLIRFILLFLIEYIFFKAIIEFWIKNNLNGWIQFFSLSFVTFFKGFFFFYLMKIIMGKLGLINNRIFDEDCNEDD